MHRLVRTPNRSLEDHRPYAGDETLESIRLLAEPLRGARVLSLSLARSGAEVSEQLREIVPLLRDLGIEAEWRIVEYTHQYADVLRCMCDGLLGRRFNWKREVAQKWRLFSSRSAREVELPYDVVVVHDPLLLGLCAESAGTLASEPHTRWAWHCHHDISDAQPDVLQNLLPGAWRCSVGAFPDYSFVPQAIVDLPLLVIPPGITPDNGDSPYVHAWKPGFTCRWHDPARPLLLQVSPLQRGYGPSAAVSMYLRAKADRPDLQLLLVDPTGKRAGGAHEAIEGIAEVARGDPDLNLVVCQGESASAVEEAAYGVATVALQCSVPSGFAPPVWRAQWKRRPVVVGRSGALSTQIVDGVTGYVAGDEDDFVDAVLDLLSEPSRAARMGAAGHDLVKRKYLVTRLLADELSMLRMLLAFSQPVYKQEMLNHV